MRRPTIHELAAAAVLVAAGVFVYGELVGRAGWTRDSVAPPPPVRPPAPIPTPAISLASSPALGSAAAALAIVNYSEFECPYCARFHEDTMPELRREYIAPGRVRMFFKHLPLEQIHSSAMRAAEAAECARAQGRFWDMHDRLFAKPKALQESDLLERARALDLEPERFAACLRGEMTERVRADLREAEQLQISSTPTFLIGVVDSDAQFMARDRLAGAQPFERFKTVLERLLSQERADR
jgi:protein-disulfide isomerase